MLQPNFSLESITEVRESSPPNSNRFHKWNHADLVRFKSESFKFWNIQIFEKFHHHKGYNKSKYENDVGLIKLKTPLKFSEAVQPACLPDHDQGYYGGALQVLLSITLRLFKTKVYILKFEFYLDLWLWNNRENHRQPK